MLLIMGTAEARAAYQPDLLVRLASEGDGGYLGEGLFEATASLQSKSQPAFPGTAASFRVLLKNAGDLPDSFLISGSGGGAGFTVRFLDQAGADRAAALPGEGFATRVLAPGETLPFLLQVVPAAFQIGASFRVAVSASSAALPARVDQVKTETVSCGSSAAVTLSAPPDGSGLPGTAVSYPYTVTNVGSADNGFTLAVESPSGWPGALYADDGAGGGIAGDRVRQGGETTPTAATGTLSPGAGYRFFLAVSIPAASADGARADTRTTVSGRDATGADQVTTNAVAATFLVAESVRNLTRGGAFAASADALPGDILQYRMAVTNSGSAPAPSVGISSAIPASTVSLPESLWIGSSPAGEGSPCAAELCGWVRESGGNIVAHLGPGATPSAGGSLAAGATLYVYFKARVQ